jgi:hypothetical protein
MCQVVWSLYSASRAVICNVGSTERFSEGGIARNKNYEFFPLDQKAYSNILTRKLQF